MGKEPVFFGWVDRVIIECLDQGLAIAFGLPFHPEKPDTLVVDNVEFLIGRVVRRA